jgi:hypothetical protein
MGITQFFDIDNLCDFLNSKKAIAYPTVIFKKSNN